MNKKQKGIFEDGREINTWIGKIEGIARKKKRVWRSEKTAVGGTLEEGKGQKEERREKKMEGRKGLDLKC